MDEANAVGALLGGLLGDADDMDDATAVGAALGSVLGSLLGSVDGMDEANAVGALLGGLLDELLHLWGWLAHGAGDWQRGLGNTDNDAVAVWALLGVVIHGFQDDSLLACVAALEEHDDLSVLKKFHHCPETLEAARAGLETADA